MYALPTGFEGLKAYKSQSASQNKVNELQQAAQSFEAFFVSMLLKSMRKGIIKSGLFSQSSGEEVFQGLFDDKIAETSAKRGSGFGVSDMLIKRLSKDIYSHGRYDKEAKNP
ncbi:MAG: hypothetical protein A2W23_08300 [Planctomycetes bacterium RBG_16_43_13]|nr:MAG: hypothetical protein A2W23_08300 [Planctomycetes bacterium RBG_16_43_13]